MLTMTCREMDAAGYERPAMRPVEIDAEHVAMLNDSGKNGEHGYAYAVRLYRRTDWQVIAVLTESVTIWLTDGVGAMGSTGAFAVRFRRGELAQTADRARAALRLAAEAQ